MIKRKRALLNPNHVSMIEVKSFELITTPSKIKEFDASKVAKFIDSTTIGQSLFDSAFTDLSVVKESMFKSPPNNSEMTVSNDEKSNQGKRRKRPAQKAIWHLQQPRIDELGNTYLAAPIKLYDPKITIKRVHDNNPEIKSRIAKVLHKRTIHKRNRIIPSEQPVQLVNTNPYTIEKKMAPLLMDKEEMIAYTEKKSNPRIAQYSFYDSPTTQDKRNVSYTYSNTVSF